MYRTVEKINQNWIWFIPKIFHGIRAGSDSQSVTISISILIIFRPPNSVGFQSTQNPAKPRIKPLPLKLFFTETSSSENFQIIPEIEPEPRNFWFNLKPNTITSPESILKSNPIFSKKSETNHPAIPTETLIPKIPEIANPRPDSIPISKTRPPKTNFQTLIQKFPNPETQKFQNQIQNQKSESTPNWIQK